MIILLISILLNITASILSWFICIQRYDGVMFGEDVFTVILWWFVPVLGFAIGIFLPFSMNAINPFEGFDNKIIFKKKKS